MVSFAGCVSISLSIILSFCGDVIRKVLLTNSVYASVLGVIKLSLTIDALTYLSAFYSAFIDIFRFDTFVIFVVKGIVKSPVICIVMWYACQITFAFFFTASLHRSPFSHKNIDFLLPFLYNKINTTNQLTRRIFYQPKECEEHL